MSQSESGPKTLLELLSAPIAFHRAFVKIGGGVTAGLLLSQAFYWSKNRTAKLRDGWFYKSHAEWEEETGLTRREQQTAREHLRDKKLLEEKIDTLPGKGRVLWFRVNLNGLCEALKTVVEPSGSAPGAQDLREGNGQSDLHKTAGGVARNRQTPLNETARPIEQKRQTPPIHAETTAETTHTLRAAGAPGQGVGGGPKSRHSKPQVQRWAEWKKSNGAKIDPDAVAMARYRDGLADDEIDDFLALPRDNFNQPQSTPRQCPTTCPLCFGSSSGMQIVDGKGARRCPNLTRQAMQSERMEVADSARKTQESAFERAAITA
jgi:hypothetical protein